MRVYFAVAERCAERDDANASVDYLTSCLRVCVEASEDAADTSDDAEGGGLDDLEKGTEGKANHRLGLAQLAAGNARARRCGTRRGTWSYRSGTVTTPGSVRR